MCAEKLRPLAFKAFVQNQLASIAGTFPFYSLALGTPKTKGQKTLTKANGEADCFSLVHPTLSKN